MHLHRILPSSLLRTAPLLLPSIAAFSSSPSTNLIMNAAASLPTRVDYLVIGGGATSMAFCDSLLHHNRRDESSSSSPSVVMVDNHDRPGGQWNDSYDFVRLHQPSDMYGVESTGLEPPAVAAHREAHRATREEILNYYEEVRSSLEKEFDFRFVGGTNFDVSQLDDSDDDDERNTDDGYKRYKLSEDRSILARKVVDGRFLQPDLPVSIPPKFAFDSSVIHCLPVNALAANVATTSTTTTSTTPYRHHVIIGAGKTGMDAIVHLLRVKHVDPSDIMWIVPNEAWITARENIGSCMEFLHDCTSLLNEAQADAQDKKSIISSTNFFQRGFVEWEKRGKIYRFDDTILPTKFKDATLSKEEMALIKSVKRVVRNGRVSSIDDDGTLHFADGTVLPPPWKEENSAAAGSAVVDKTLFVHCSAGAFNYSKQTKKPPPIFGRHRISIQDVYGTPGFCFVGSVIGKLEALDPKVLTNDDKNAMCLSPRPDASQANLPLGPSGGDIGVLSSNHGYVQRLCNLKQWLQVPDVRDWLVSNRLFNLRHKTVEEIDLLVDDTLRVLEECGIVN